jgi:hypothetical protein
MWRSAVLRFAVLSGIATFACWSGNNAPRTQTPIDNRGAPLAQETPAEPYWCSISDSGYDYPQMPCSIRTVDGQRVLAKLAGSQRIRGVITPSGDGFSFDGELFCPWGDCTKRLVGTFRPTGDGALRGTFDGDSMIVTLVRAPADSAWGGSGYGGASYGGAGYGGFGYGGARKHRKPY